MQDKIELRVYEGRRQGTEIKNKNNPDVVIPISVYVTAEGEIWGNSIFYHNAYYEISGLETIKLIPLGCGF